MVQLIYIWQKGQLDFRAIHNKIKCSGVLSFVAVAAFEELSTSNHILAEICGLEVAQSTNDYFPLLLEPGWGALLLLLKSYHTYSFFDLHVVY